MTRRFSWTTSLASVQWLFFIFANTVVVPISIGTAFDLDAMTVAGTLRSSLLITGLACILQGWIGHRYPLMEGHSGMMWGIMLGLSASAASMGMSLAAVGGGIATGMLLAGGVILILSAARLLHVLQKIFTPMVTSVYLFLLTFQLSFIFFDGMLQKSPEGALELPVSLFSIAIVIFTGLLIIKGGEKLSRFAILIGIGAGWLGYVLLFPANEAALPPSGGGMGFPIFPLGKPNWNISIITVTFIACLVNLSNTITSVQAAARSFNEQPKKEQFQRSYLLSGFYTLGAGVFGLVSYAPFTSSIGFLESTRIFDRKPFFIGGGLMALLGLIPFLSSLLASMPATVGNAVLFVAYLQLFGTSLKSLNGYTFNSVTIFRIAVPVLAGVCILSADPVLFSQIPGIAQPLVSNGFLAGVFLSIILESVMNWSKAE